MKAWLLALVLAGGACKKKESAPAAEPRAAQMSVDEIKRSEDACKVYVERACSCAAAQAECSDARPLGDAIRIALEVSRSPDSKPDVVLQTQASVRKTVKHCIEATAKLASLGCPTP
jgi:hypothetical protein